MAESTKLEDILAQARAIGSQRMSLPQPVKTGSTWKDFVLNALQTAPMGVGARMPPMATVGAMPKGVALKSDLGAPQVSGGGMAENANVFNPKVNDVLSFLSKENIPTNKVQDSKGGTSYIYTENPNKLGDKLKIRVPNDEHVAGWDRIKGTDPFRFMDLGTKRTGAGNPKLYNRNASGEMYGKEPGAMEDAIKHRFGLDIVEPGRSLTQPRPRDLNTQNLKPIEPDPNQLSLHDLIDKTIGDMEKPTINPTPENTRGFDYVPGMNRPQSVAPKLSIYGEKGANSNPTFRSNVIEAPFSTRPNIDLDLLRNSSLNYMPGNTLNKVKAISAGNMEKPQLSTSEMQDMSKTIDEVLRKYEYLRP